MHTLSVLICHKMQHNTLEGGEINRKLHRYNVMRMMMMIEEQILFFYQLSSVKSDSLTESGTFNHIKIIKSVLCRIMM